MRPSRPPLLLALGLGAALLPGLALAGHNSSLAQLNTTLSGRLQTSIPLAHSCFSQPNGAACAALKKQLPSAYFRIGSYEGFQNLQGEACVADPADQCLLTEGSLAKPSPSARCNQGVLSRNFVEVTGPADVQAVLAYSRATGTPLSIKGSGHDYNMRSSRRGSLAIWTRGLRDTAFHPSFVADGCPPATHPRQAVTFGAGVTMTEAMTFAHAHNATFPAGSSATVGASGGWALNGGHSVLSPGFGLAADRVLQFAIVTPDGQHRIANACTNPSLFWALRGGGGGAFGVVLSSTHAAEPDGPVTSAIISFPGTPATLNPWISLLAEHAPAWTRAGWGGPSAANLSFLVNPFAAAAAESDLAPAIAFARAHGGAAAVQTYPSFFDYWAATINASSATPEPVSTALFATSRIVPESVFLNTSARAALVGALVATATDLGLATYFMADLPLRWAQSHPAAEADTALPAAWYSSVWHVVAYAQWDGGAPLAQRRGAVQLLRNATRILGRAAGPDACTYANEADPWLDDWAAQFWGDKYERLVQVKRSVDPDGLLSCWHCVGWDASLPGYECVEGLAV
ncbi:hypothetical protein B0T26DRAFT_632951 [Lasiosphaeria miniovina]|uniref:FAD-binding PCMH-type domain-containing protein n=1 Tax=Lasiosphaeria miniovina TaxID=1954250 RepID=A0AA40BEX6_9PEZI|nr:uncharacterized protein B0T26DRAFT_632951 [Lasiosphaeria miniovina]KAK0732955.1 hypothetical protein B0T26DRAFT_632951 [Lasiosphaeria miniovina]